MKIHVIKLTKEERIFLSNLLKKGKHSVRKVIRARVLLLSNEGKKDPEITKILNVSESMVYKLRTVL